MGFDLGLIETRKHVEVGVFFPILHPKTREPLKDENGDEIKIRISGADASRIKSAVEERQAARRAAAVAAEAAAAAKGQQPGAAVVEYGWQDREKERVDDLVLLTEGWTDNVMLDGKPLPFSKENARTLYERFPEIAEQMAALATNRLNFMPTSAKD